KMKWQQALKEYQNYLRIERGLSENTVINYGMDIQKLINWLDENQVMVSPLTIKNDEIQQFIYTIAKQLNSRSQSRIISGLRGFFNFMIFEDYRKDNPLDLIESPKSGRKLPDTLSQEEINLLISAI